MLSVTAFFHVDVQHIAELLFRNNSESAIKHLVERREDFLPVAHYQIDAEQVQTESKLSKSGT